MAEPIEVLDALESLAAARPNYTKYSNYFHGRHDLQFASPSYRDRFGRLIKAMRYNRCQTVVDSISDRLQVESWQTDAHSEEDTANEAANEQWIAARGDFLQGLVHVEALRSGDAYLIVWPSPDDEMTPLWRVQRADSCRIITDDETANPVMAIKCWQVSRGADKGKWRLTIYDDMVITRWITRKDHDIQPDSAGAWEPFTSDGEPSGVNPYGVLPVIHFPNNPQFQGECGISELEDLIPLQDGLNYSIWQLMVAGEFSAWPMTWATGAAPQIDPLTGQTAELFKAGIDRFLTVAEPMAKIGQLPGMDLNTFIETQESWDQKISRVSRVPVHWLGVIGQLPSGESLKTAESPFVGKLRDRQLAFGAAWADAMKLALTIAGQTGEAYDTLEPVWRSPEPRSDSEIWMLAQQKQAVGVPQEQIWREAGYSEEQVAEFLELNEAKAKRDAEQFGRAFGQGRDDPFAPDEEQSPNNVSDL